MLFLKIQLILLIKKVSENINFFVVSIKKIPESISFDWYEPEYMGTIADWVSGLGTLLAIIVTLYFSTRDNRKRMKVSWSWSYIVYGNGDTSSDGMLTIDAVNIGKIPVHISNVGLIKRKRPKFFIGRLEKMFPKSFVKMQFIKFAELSETTPTILSGQEAKTFRNSALSGQLKNHKHTSKRMRVYVQDSTGKFYYSKKFKL